MYVREFLPSYAWSERSVSTLPLVRDMLREEAVIRVIHAATVSFHSYLFTHYNGLYAFAALVD